MNQMPFVFYCRPGFESDCAAEIQDFANSYDLAGYPNAKPNSGCVRFYCFDQDSSQQLFEALDINELIFVRQWFWAQQELDDLPLQDRITPILGAVAITTTDNIQAQKVLVEHLDDDAGRELSKFCKKFTTPLTIALEKHELLDSEGDYQLHLLFLTNNHCLIGISPIGKASELKGGIVRLKFPKDAPSRSTLKLEEAFLSLMSGKKRKQVLRLGNTAVDLGAAPGGWTYQLVKHGLQVTAIDNGPMDKKLMATEHVIHLRENALAWLPEKPVHMLVCDMVEKPSLVAKLMAKWLVQGKTEHAIFNLKLPMKKRYQEVADCLDMICDALEEHEIEYDWHAKHLYHDREEITAYFRRKMPKLN